MIEIGLWLASRRARESRVALDDRRALTQAMNLAAELLEEAQRLHKSLEVLKLGDKARFAFANIPDI
eukprot:6194872-Pleurochrysis_carterae.AAC.1